MKIGILVVVCMVTMLVFSGSALALTGYTDAQVSAACQTLNSLSGYKAVLGAETWPTSPTSDQYVEVNNAMETAVAAAGISPETFIGIYDAAGPGYTAAYDNLGCSTLAAAGPTRGALPSTGIALGLLVGSGVVGIGAASRLLKRKV